MKLIDSFYTWEDTITFLTDLHGRGQTRARGRILARARESPPQNSHTLPFHNVIISFSTVSFFTKPRGV